MYNQQTINKVFVLSQNQQVLAPVVFLSALPTQASLYSSAGVFSSFLLLTLLPWQAVIKFSSQKSIFSAVCMK